MYHENMTLKTTPLSYENKNICQHFLKSLRAFLPLVSCKKPCAKIDLPPLPLGEGRGEGLFRHPEALFLGRIEKYPA
jgi:hypothetical protein